MKESLESGKILRNNNSNMEDLKLFPSTVNDTDIYTSDFNSVKEGQWITDAIIKYSFDDIMQIKISNEAILFLNPSLVSWLKIGCEEDCDFENVAESIKLSTRKWLIITINNNNSVHIKGSHWSLLLCNIEHGFLFHFDSSNDNNHDAAFETAKSIYKLLSRNDEPNIRQINRENIPQQINGFDCGIYTLLFGEYVANKINNLELENKDISDNNELYNHYISYFIEGMKNNITSNSVSEYRNFLYNEILNQIRNSKNK